MDLDFDNNTNTQWQLERARSKKVCIRRGECVFKAGFSRKYEITKDNEEDLPLDVSLI